MDTSDGPNACWPWTGTRTHEGYGVLGGGKRNQQNKAHRVAWELAYAQAVPEGLLIRHLCPGGGNPWCCNPLHLEPGTVQQNSDDKVNADRHGRGVRNGRARLTEEQVREIRIAGSSGFSQSSVAHKYGVTYSTVHGILTGRIWSHVR